MDDNYDENVIDEDSPDESQPIYSICCFNMPESLLDPAVVKDHFNKFGTITRIILRPKKYECIVNYESQFAMEKAVLNAGAYDGHMFDVRANKPKRNRPKADDDPDWVPDPELASELNSMKNEQYSPRLQRQQKMELERLKPVQKAIKKGLPKEFRKTKALPIKSKLELKTNEEPRPVIAKTKHLEKDDIKDLLTKSWTTPEEKLKALDMRDKIIRSRLIVRKGAIKGCCPDMCPERERLLRQCQRQAAHYELDPETGQLNPYYAVKQYSRSSADQEEPLPHDLRPVPVLKQTLLYLLENIVDNCDDPMVELGDWFHFLWDRLRAIRKDITQQALCCSESVRIIEACARFHAHCAARLIEEPPSSFDQRLNTENLLKCLQTLKYMYGDLRTRNDTAACVNEPEFRAYIILLNLKDSNFMWEVQQLDRDVQTSPEVRFAIQVFSALDNKNYTKFFKLVKQSSYLNACILLRYFNDIRLQALYRMIKSYSPRGASQFPANDLLNILAFETYNSMIFYLDHYGLQTTAIKDVTYVLLDRNSFYENDNPYALERAINLIESKRTERLSDTIFGSKLPEIEEHIPHNSFAPSNCLKRSAILAEDQGFVPAEETVEEIDAIINNTSLPIKPPTVVKSGPIQPVKSYTFGAPATTHIPKGNSLFAQNQNTTNQPPGVDIFKNITYKPNVQFKFSNPANPQPFSKPVDPISVFGKVEENKNKVNPMDVFGAKSTTNIFNQGPTEVFGKSPASVFSSTVVKPTAFNNVPTDPSSVFGNSIFKPSSLTTAADNQPTNILTTSQFPNNQINFPSALDIQLQEDKMRLEQEAQMAAQKQEEERLRQEELLKKRKKEEIIRILEQQQAARLAKEQAEKLAREQAEKLAREKAEKLAREKAEQLAREQAERLMMQQKRLDFEARVESESKDLVPQLLNEVIDEICTSEIKENIRWINKINQTTLDTLTELILEVSQETCNCEIALATRLKEIGLRFLLRSCIFKWRNASDKIRRRRNLLFTTPAWLPLYDVIEPHPSQTNALKRMKLFHRGSLPSLKIPSPKIKGKISLFDLVKKPLVQKSQELRSSSNLFWKVTMSAPSENECRNVFLFFKKWFPSTFSTNDDVPKTDYLIYLKEHFWHKKVTLSLSSIFGSQEKAQKYSTDGSNGFIFYSTGDTQSLATLNQRIESALASDKICTPLPIAIILLTSKNKSSYEHRLNLSTYRKDGKISEYIFLSPETCNDETIVSVTKKALYWLARRNTPYPSIECNLAGQFLDQCIGSELYYRFNVSKNSSIRPAFENISTLIDLHNTAVEKTIEIITHGDLMRCPSFPEEFKQFLFYDNIYPKEFPFVDNDWKANNRKVAASLQIFKLPQYKPKCELYNAREFQSEIENFLDTIRWFSRPDDIADKICSMITNPNILNAIPWMDVLNFVISEKISEFVRTSTTRLLIVVYKKEHLQNYRTSPWWYRTPMIRKIDHVVESYPSDEIDMSLRKKPRLDTEEIPDDSWFNSIFNNLNDSIDNVNKCKMLISNLNESLDLESKRQSQLEAILKSALEEG